MTAPLRNGLYIVSVLIAGSRSVELYIKLGKRVRATIGQLGYPTKNALKGWYRQYEQRLDLPKGYARPKPKYSQEQKEAAVRHYFDHGRCIAGTMKALGYQPSLPPSMHSQRNRHPHSATG